MTSDLTIWLGSPGVSPDDEVREVFDLIVDLDGLFAAEGWFDLADIEVEQAEAARVADVTVAPSYL
jgi:hypothetical protein